MADTTPSSESMAAIFKALGDESRLQIVKMLNEKPDLCACNILEAFDFTQPSLSRHMKILCAAGLVDCRRDGRWMHYALNREGFARILPFWETMAEDR